MPNEVDFLKQQLLVQQQQMQQQMEQMETMKLQLQLLQSQLQSHSQPIEGAVDVVVEEPNVEEPTIEQPAVEEPVNLSKKTLPLDAVTEFKSAKQNPQRSVDGYQFRRQIIKRSGQPDREEWRCTMKSCRVQAKFSDLGVSFSNLNEDGFHPLHGPNKDRDSQSSF